jgi:hypothetical protein
MSKNAKLRLELAALILGIALVSTGAVLLQLGVVNYGGHRGGISRPPTILDLVITWAISGFLVFMFGRDAIHRCRALKRRAKRLRNQGSDTCP